MENDGRMKNGWKLREYKNKYCNTGKLWNVKRRFLVKYLKGLMRHILGRVIMIILVLSLFFGEYFFPLQIYKLEIHDCMLT